MKKAKSELRGIPGVGENIEQDLLNLGYSTLESLKGQDPEEMYRRDCRLKGFQEDKCQLYVYRLAVYFAEHAQPEPDKLKWWNWKEAPPER
ncbi:helix-hairpin-helix domain-containing protein [Victivallis sp. Marseille-Q1083]|uniref:helix-hairpin-helix domain-containing protein n=1 Tax=Victivallis sp. Marseille-Q1083 TaxID=2717288 RepID=UPI00158E5130|nr:helix-hairpin-helix domain-containing protein [Victivallis sp. Marseille-Q1083]